MKNLWGRLVARRSVRYVGTSVLVVVLLLAGWLATERTAASQPWVQEPTVAVSTRSAPKITVPDWAPTQPDVTWHEIANVDLPVSRIAGPYQLTKTRASGFSHDSAGAALAAAHILVRSFAGVGSNAFVPTIREQVTGAAKAQLLARTQQAYDGAVRSMDVRDGEPLPTGQGWVVAYRVVGGAEASSTDARTVQVLVEGSGESLGFTEYTVDLVWSGSDWLAVAPTFGDWGYVARAVRNPYPTSYRSYDDIAVDAGVGA